MTTILNRTSIITNLAQGMGTVMPQLSVSSVSVNATGISGYFTGGLRVNSLGTTIPSTLVQMLSMDTATNQLLSVYNAAPIQASGKTTYLGRFYRIGSVVLSATGNQFTHDAATFPVTRTVMGAANTAINLIPLVYVTTSTTVTAPVIQLETSIIGNGYVNQSGTAVTGNVAFTFPAAATPVGSTYVPMLNNGDSAVQNILQVNVTTAATVGACDIYGFEPMMCASNMSAGSYPATHNAAIGAMTFTDTRPAVATSGTVTSYLGYLSLLADTVGLFAGVDICVANQ